MLTSAPGGSLFKSFQISGSLSPIRSPRSAGTGRLNIFAEKKDGERWSDDEEELISFFGPVVRRKATGWGRPLLRIHVKEEAPGGAELNERLSLFLIEELSFIFFPSPVSFLGQLHCPSGGGIWCHLSTTVAASPEECLQCKVWTCIGLSFGIFGTRPLMFSSRSTILFCTSTWSDCRVKFDSELLLLLSDDFSSLWSLSFVSWSVCDWPLAWNLIILGCFWVWF